MSRTPDPKSKAGFVRAQPTTLTAAAVVAKAKASGVKLDERYVYSVRTTMNKASRKAAKTSSGSAPRKRAADGHVGNGLEAEIERIVEAKVSQLLKERLGTLFGR